MGVLLAGGRTCAGAADVAASAPRGHHPRAVAGQGIRGAAGAFSLIELMVVIGIIGILAGLTVAFVSRSSTHRKMTRLEHEREQIQLWIDEYKHKKGYYPLDNTNNPALQPLYYELAGTLVVNGPGGADYTTRDGRRRTISSNELRQAFTIQGLLNASVTTFDAAADAPSFLTHLREDQLKPLTTATNVVVLVAPLPGPSVPEVNGNPWRYRSTYPLHNPDGYDLWAEVEINGQIITNGNWKN